MKRLLLLLLLSGCDSLPLIPTVLPDWKDLIDSEWLIAQVNVFPLVGLEAYTIHPRDFRWQQEDALFDCGGILTNGCFWASRELIAWNTNVPTVIRQEAEHAILWKLKHDEWIAFPHREQ